MILDEHKRTLRRLITEAQEMERLARSAGRHAAADSLAEYHFKLDAGLEELKVAESEIA
jgi:hypothetical protein